MVHTDGRNKEKPVIERTFYQCRIYRVRGTGFCSQHRINADDLEELVLADIQTHAKRVIKTGRNSCGRYWADGYDSGE